MLESSLVLSSSLGPGSSRKMLEGTGALAIELPMSKALENHPG